MATAKKGTELATATPTGEAGLALPSELLDAFKEFGGGESNLQYIDKPFFQLSIKNARFKIGDNVIGDTVIGHLMRITDVRAYYETKYDPNKPTPPDCGSVGGIQPDAHSEKKQSKLCASCPMNQWNTGTGADGKPSRGKACRQSKRLVLHMNDISLPVLLSLPPTSARALDVYLKMISTIVPGGVPAFATMCEFSFDPKSDYPKVEMTLKDVVRDVAQIRELAALRNSQPYIDAEQAFATHEEFAPDEGVTPSGVDKGAGTDY